jgi:hypothetical protein
MKMDVRSGAGRPENPGACPHLGGMDGEDSQDHWRSPMPTLCQDIKGTLDSRNRLTDLQAPHGRHPPPDLVARWQKSVAQGQDPPGPPTS